MQQEAPESQETTSPDNGDKRANKIRYSLARKEEEVEFEDEHGNVVVYTLREMTGIKRDKWLNANSTRMKYDREGNPVGMKVFDNFQAALIAQCLYDARGAMVPESTISNWPSSLQSELFQKCQQMNALTVQSREEAKKD
jgi:hypothetical protein